MQESDPDPVSIQIRIQFFQDLIHGSGPGAIQMRADPEHCLLLCLFCFANKVIQNYFSCHLFNNNYTQKHFHLELKSGAEYLHFTTCFKGSQEIIFNISLGT